MTYQPFSKRLQAQIDRLAAGEAEVAKLRKAYSVVVSA